MLRRINFRWILTLSAASWSISARSAVGVVAEAALLPSPQLCARASSIAPVKYRFFRRSIFLTMEVDIGTSHAMVSFRKAFNIKHLKPIFI